VRGSKKRLPTPLITYSHLSNNIGNLRREWNGYDYASHHALKVKTLLGTPRIIIVTGHAGACSSFIKLDGRKKSAFTGGPAPLQTRPDSELGVTGFWERRQETPFSPIDQVEASVKAKRLAMQTHGFPQNTEAPGQEKEIE